MIVVEGPDGAGKSTLCKHLSKRFGLPLSEHSRLSSAERNDPSFRSPEASRNRTYSCLLRAITGRHKCEIHDRYFYSEMVYTEVIKERECVFEFGEQRHISRMLMGLECPVIFCLPPWEEVAKQRYNADQWDEAIKRLNDTYNTYVLLAKFMSRRKVKGVTNRDQPYDYNQPLVIKYNFKRPSDLDVVEDVVEKYLIRREARTRSWHE